MLGEEDKALDPLMRVVASDDCGAPWVQVTDGGRLCELSREKCLEGRTRYSSGDSKHSASPL